ncbi:MAG: bifunctional demethylmenaquinone methyltransferase/2-methoxy-6-polyprenyl-1,4-benzoquinol methylase UbiE [Candidatus Omnitrophota bacterium]
MVHEPTTTELFNAIAPAYDRLNTVLSLGFHRFWKRSLHKFLPGYSDLYILDAATGTADVAIELIRHHPEISMITGIDPSDAMLKIAGAKVAKAGLSGRIELQRGIAENIPFADRSFDAATMSFGIRNISDRINALNEMFRVLKAEGRLIILEFSRPSQPFVYFFYKIYMQIFVKFLGGVLSGNRKAYDYLYRSVWNFPSRQEFCQMLAEAGFQSIRTIPVCLGVATIYLADKAQRKGTHG